MRKIKFLYIFSLLFLINFTEIFAQDPLFRHYTTNEGLPSSTIYPMTQDRDGFIWFGTDVGVTRFDGKKFQNYTLADGLSDNYILSVKTDSKGRIWFLGFNGTVSYWLNGKIYNEKSDTLLKVIKSFNSFVDFFEDNKHRLWFISLYEYLMIDNGKVTKEDGYAGIVMNGKSGQIIITPHGKQFSYYTNKKSLLKLKYKLKINSGYYTNKDGSVLFISDEGIIQQKDTIQKILIPFNGEFDNIRLGSMAISLDSLLWVTTMGNGMYCYDLKNKSAKPKIYLKDEITVSAIADKEDNIWVSTLNNGLYMIPVMAKHVTLYNDKNKLLDNHQCYSINKLHSGELLVGLNKGILQKISPSATTQVNIPKCESEYSQIIKIVSFDDDLWIASNCGLIHQNTKKGCNHFVNSENYSQNSQLQKIYNIKDISVTKTNIYIANGYNLFEYPLACTHNSPHKATVINSSKSNKRIYSIFCDYSSRLWFGNIDGLNSKIEDSFVNHSKENFLLSQRINSIAETDDSVLIIGTHGFGLLFYKNGKIINQITQAAGLCNDICRRVYVHKGHIYVCTPSGVSILEYSKGKMISIQNMNTGNFLPSNDVNDIFVDDMSISVATMEGAVMLKLSDLKKVEPIIPRLHITGIVMNDSIIDPNIKSIFPHDKNSLKVNFIGIYFQQPNAVNYRYRLKDNLPWQQTEKNELDFPFLEPGDYTFQLQASVKNGEWSALQSFSFSITPPYWKTTRFLFWVIMILIFVIYILVKSKLRTIKNQAEEKARIVKQITELEQQALQTMMNPHFIFNVMNSIQYFINANEKEAANRYLSNFATLIRLNLTISYKKYIPLEEEINYLELYLSFEKLRFGDKLNYEFKIAPEIDPSETIVPVMMIQPFIENAILHGILPMSEKGHIHIQIDKENDELIKITVEDTGVGIDEKFLNNDFYKYIKESHALSMTLQRLHLLGKSSNKKLYIHYKHAHPELEHKGTIAELILPATFY